LRRLGAALKNPQLANYRFKLAGHTDSKGSVDYNQKLSAICCTAPTPSAFVETILPWCSSQTGKTIVAKFDGGQLKSDRSI
jgi:hypothetical protein